MVTAFPPVAILFWDIHSFSICLRGFMIETIKQEGEHSMKSFTLRMDEDMLQKLHYLAEYEGRSVNRQLHAIIRKTLKEYERQGILLPEYHKQDRDKRLK